MGQYDREINWILTHKADDADALRDCFALAMADGNHNVNKQIRVLAINLARQGNRDAADLYDKTLLYDASIDFDCYLRYVEHNRKSRDQFYLPRRHYLREIVQGYQDLFDGKIKLLTVSLPKRAGKALTLDTPIATPSGFVRMGDIRVGDFVVGRDGKPTRVTDVFPQGKVPVYKVRFSDGAEIKTCGNHLWEVKWHDKNRRSGEQQYYTKILTTEQIFNSEIKAKTHNLYSVRYCGAVEFEKKPLPLDPYVLGVLLGDGTLRDGTAMFTSFDAEVPRLVSERVPDGDVAYCQSEKKGRWIIRSMTHKTDNYGYPLKSNTAFALERLDLLGKLSWEKHIPQEYLYSSVADRMELLRGLLDTDGYSSSKCIEYSTTSPNLRDGVIFLVRSLGGKATYSARMGSYKKNGVKILTRENYRVHIFFPSGVVPFHIERKAKAYNPKRAVLYHYIESIEPCGEDYAQCICVDNADHLYLVSEYFVPTHNSQTGINFVNWLSGMRPDRSTLMEGAGDALVRSFYKGCLEYLDPRGEYSFYDVFPSARLVETNADLKTINLEGKSRFPTIMCRSIDSTQVGLSEATNLLYLDDCVEGREEAKNRNRLDEKWEVISGDVIGRALECPIVMTGTRYSLYDPIGRMQEYAAKMGWAWKAIEKPAIDPVTGKSNYEYFNPKLEKTLFTVSYFNEQKMLLTDEQYESEFNQAPFEAKGLTFPKNKLNRYFELPVDRDPDAIVAVCDTAEGGGDSVMLPIAYVYGDDVFIHDCVFDDSPPNVTKAECAKKLVDNNVSVCTFESNAAGAYYARDVETLCKEKGGRISIRTKRTISNKQTRIENASDGILKHFFFKDESLYEPFSQYGMMMKELTTYTRTGKVPHDDAPDGLSLLENELRHIHGNQVEIVKRTW